MRKFKWLFPESDIAVMAFFRDQGYDIVSMSRKHEGYDGIVFTGGEDVTPFLYGKAKHSTTFCNLDRDLREVAIFNNSPLDMPKIGICRGAQFLNVKNHGSMWQDVDKHAIGGCHDARSDDGQVFMVTSTHHQMMIPGHGNNIVMLSAKESTRNTNVDTEYRYKQGEENDWDDIEALFYWETNSFCFQPHPEYSYAPDEMKLWFWEQVEQTLFKEEIEKITLPTVAKVG